MDRRMSDRGLDGGVTYHGTMHQQAPPVRQVTVGGLNQYCYDQHNSCLPIDNAAPTVRQVAVSGQTQYTAVGEAPLAHQLSKEEGGGRGPRPRSKEV